MSVREGNFGELKQGHADILRGGASGDSMIITQAADQPSAPETYTYVHAPADDLPIARDVRSVIQEPAGLSRRGDIDGMRAVAVLSVLAYHAFPAFAPWGFIGVDVFFVISGYLITTILLQGQSDGRHPLVDFYARRIRRIFPALISVLLATCVAGLYLALPQDMRELGRHIAAAGGFVSNLLLWSESGYFDKAAAAKPLLHLWSLGIEEQFYIAWPALLWAVRKRPRLLVVACVLPAALSFAHGMFLLTRTPTAAFYSPLSRMWELLAGGALAIWVLRHPAPLEGHDEIKSIVAIVLFVTGAVVINDTRPFPGAYALLPVATAALLIAAPKSSFNRRILGSPLLVWIGLISYPLYLWHWPLLVFAREINGGALAPSTSIGCLVLAAALAWLTFRFVEQPLRYKPHAGAKAIILTAAMGVTIAIGLLAVTRDGFPDRFPSLARSLLGYEFDYKREWRVGTCFLDQTQQAADFDRCPDRISAGSVLLWGDSHAAHLMPGMRSEYGQQTSLVQRSASLCPPLLGLDLKQSPACRAMNDRVMQEIRMHRPGVVVLSAAWVPYGKTPYLAQTLRELRAAGVPRVIIVGPTPRWKTPVPQRLLLEMRRDALHRIPIRILPTHDTGYGEIDEFLRTVASGEGVSYVDARSFLCNADGCLVRQGDAPGDLLFWDAAHLTLRGSRYVAEQIPLRH